jgi:hypothetical protein
MAHIGRSGATPGRAGHLPKIAAAHEAARQSPDALARVAGSDPGPSAVEHAGRCAVPQVGFRQPLALDVVGGELAQQPVHK